MKENSTGKTLFILAGLVAVIALILSVSRLFLSTSDRNTIEGYWFYDITQTSQMMAFLSIMFVSVPLLLIGSFIRKNYDIIGLPLMIGGLLTMVFETTVVFAVFYMSSHNQTDTMTAEIVLTFTIAIEWLMLVVYLWINEGKVAAPAPVSSMPSNPSNPPQSSEVNINDSLPPTIANK
jgi:hypothetical protein